MSIENFFELIKVALPYDIDADKLKTYAPQKLWQKSSYLASVYALSHCPRINWVAYKENYCANNAYNIDPWIHFINTGLYKGYKLFSYHHLYNPQSEGEPALSIIIINHNNATYLPYAVESIINQTYKDLEIIIVDDASTDNSLNIMNVYAKKDRRIKLINFKKNVGTFMARKLSVQQVKGQYIMFLDSDDFFTVNACEIAYKAVLKGYDAVIFNEKTINSANISPIFAQNHEKYINRAPAGIYNGKQIMEAAFNQDLLPRQLAKMLCLKDILAAAYSSLPDGYFIRSEDALGMSAVLPLIRSLIKIDDQLYNYRYGLGISSKHDISNTLDRFFTLGKSIKAIGCQLEKHAIEINFPKFAQDHCKLLLQRWIDFVPDDQSKQYYQRMINDFSFVTVFSSMVDKFFNKPLKLVEKFYNCGYDDNLSNPDIKAVAIYSDHINFGGVFTIIKAMANALNRVNIKTYIFTQKIKDNLAIPSDFRIIFLKPSGTTSAEMLEHGFSLQKELQENNIDLLLHTRCASPTLFWHFVICQHINVPVILNSHNNFAMLYTKVYNGKSITLNEAIFRCMPAVACLSKSAELYYRSRGINATYIPNPISPLPKSMQSDVCTSNIALMGRITDRAKGVFYAIPIMKRVISRLPEARLYIIGQFESDKISEDFKNALAKEGLEHNIIITGWTNNPSAILQKCSLLLSLSYIEAFPMNICEALSAGLPCVIYSLPIEIAENNPAIISVPQGNIEHAASAIIKLLSDTQYLQELSKYAKEYIKLFSSELYAKKLIKYINNFNLYSSWSAPKQKQYAQIVRTIAWYAAHPKPI